MIRTPSISQRGVFIAVCLLMFAAAILEFWMGRKLWGSSGVPGLWSGDIWSSHNSQFLFDPYTFTHITHGVLLYALLSLACKRLPVHTRLLPRRKTQDRPVISGGIMMGSVSSVKMRLR